MPTYTFRCPNQHTFDIFFKTFSAALPRENDALCDCGETGVRVQEAPLGFGLYGDPAGYANPSPTKRHSTKLVSSKDGNRNSVG